MADCQSRYQLINEMDETNSSIFSPVDKISPIQYLDNILPLNKLLFSVLIIININQYHFFGRQHHQIDHVSCRNGEYLCWVGLSDPDMLFQVSSLADVGLHCSVRAPFNVTQPIILSKSHWLLRSSNCILGSKLQRLYITQRRTFCTICL